MSFDGVSTDRVAEMHRDMQDEEQPEGLNASELIMLHDPDAKRSLVILFFESEDDYRRGDDVLDAMPTGDTPGRRSGVAKYQVAHRMTS